ncbi:MAG: SAM-dependent methyltransferase [Desulfobacteraceae bacterium]|jgi:methyltransferase (TIGR00027 family)|nr:SAM-dependent methyltransferase [Desulfobacteraceae bacterium]
MRAKEQSITAEHNAALRAIESLRPPGERICFDPLARFFVPARLAAAVASIDCGEKLIASWESVVPGICTAILARTGFIDACLGEALEHGLDQVVILGAGFDTRALRFDALQAGVPVFELDHPATQAVKIARMRRVWPSLPDHLHFIPIRFEAENLAAKLLAHRYRPDGRTFFVWEGVTYYIGASAVDAVFEFIAGHCAAGSGVVFDYLPPAVIDGTCLQPEAVGLRDSLAMFGEALIFGIDPDRIDRFLARRGLRTLRHLRSDQYPGAATGGGCVGRRPSPLFFFVQAQVEG